MITAIMLTTALALSYLNRSEPIKVRKPLSMFPMSIGEWNGKLDHFDDWVYKKIGVDDSALVHYTNENNDYVQLYIGYYASQREGDTIHSPRNCMPGGGWNIAETKRIDLEVPSHNPKTVKVLLLTIQNGLRKQLVLYWFHSRGRVISSEYHQKAYLIIDSITKRRTDGSFVRLISPVNTDEKKTLKLLKKFASELFPRLDDFLPS